MLTTLAALSLVASPFLPVPGAAAPVHPNHKVPIDVLNVTGTGCRPGTTTVAMSADDTAFTVSFSGYTAAVGGTAKKPDADKTCRIKLKVAGAPGFSSTITGVDHRGFAILAAGATATQLAAYTFQGSPPAPDRSHPFVGPYDDDWQTHDATDPGAISYGGCGAARGLTVSSELKVDAGSSDPAVTSLIGMDSADGALPVTYHLSWRTC